MVFFPRKGEVLKNTSRAEDYTPGDLVTGDLPGNLPHIGMVVDRKSGATGRYMIVHKVGQAPKHYRYLGPGS